MPLRLLHHRGLLPEPLGLLHSSSFQHKPFLCADCEALHGQGGVRLSRRPWEVGPVARPVTVRGVLQEGIPRPRFPQLVSVTMIIVKEILEVSRTVSCPEVTVNSEPVVLQLTQKCVLAFVQMVFLV